MSVISNLTYSDLQIYKNYQKYMYKNQKSHFNIHDIVRIKYTISHDKGYMGNTGIIANYSGVDNHVQVFAYNLIEKKYSVCGFDEDDLKYLPFSLTQIDVDLKESYLNYLERNFFQIKNLKEILIISNNNKISLNNVICVDFIKKNICN